MRFLVSKNTPSIASSCKALLRNLNLNLSEFLLASNKLSNWWTHKKSRCWDATVVHKEENVFFSLFASFHYCYFTQWCRRPSLISSGGWFTQTQWTHQLLPPWLVRDSLGGGTRGGHDKRRRTPAAAVTDVRQVCLCVCVACLSECRTHHAVWPSHNIWCDADTFLRV